MRQWLKIGWVAWGLAWLLFALGMWAHHVSTQTIIVPLVLEPGQVVEIPVYRLRPDTVRLDLRFETHGEPRPELGEWVYREKEGALFFASPGSPVMLQVRTPGHVQRFEAWPVSAHGTNDVLREMVPFVDDGDPHRFSWPAAEVTRSLPKGHSVLEVSVLDVGQSIRGEPVQLWLQRPLGFKVSDEAYSWLWMFFFWPVLVVMLLLAGIALAALGRWAHGRPAGEGPPLAGD